eukprot:5518157-Prymnesium_polylepis.1
MAWTHPSVRRAAGVERKPKTAQNSREIRPKIASEKTKFPERNLPTPSGTIIGMLGDKELKPETDPGWEARQPRLRSAQSASVTRPSTYDDTPEASSESSERNDPKESSPLSFAGSAPELLVSEDEEPF